MCSAQPAQIYFGALCGPTVLETEPPHALGSKPVPYPLPGLKIPVWPKLLPFPQPKELSSIVKPGEARLTPKEVGYKVHVHEAR